MNQHSFSIIRLLKIKGILSSIDGDMGINGCNAYSCPVSKLGTHAVVEAVDIAIESVKLFLKNEKIVKILGSYDLAKCYRIVADELRSIIGKINAKDLVALFKKASDNFGFLIDALPKAFPKKSIAVLREKYNDMVVIQSQIGNNIDACIGPV